MFLGKLKVKQNTTGYYYIFNDDFCVTINWLTIKTSLKEEDIINILTSVYSGVHSVFCVKFKNKYDAECALEWIESMLLINELLINKKV